MVHCYRKLEVNMKRGWVWNKEFWGGGWSQLRPLSPKEKIQIVIPPKKNGLSYPAYSLRKKKFLQ